MGMGMGSREKRSGGSSVFVCVVLGLALLLVLATAKDLADIVNYSCKPKCGQQFDPSSDSYVGCMFGCDLGFSVGMRLQAHGDTSGEGGKKMKRGINAAHLLSNSRCDEQCSQVYDRSSSSFSECMTICSMI